MEDDINMFYGAVPEIFLIAKELRKNMTPAEKYLWSYLNKKQFQNIRFKPQHPVKSYIVDFYCHQKKLVIEIDGEIHNNIEQNDSDQARTWELEELGLKVIRFSNYQVINNIESVLNIIKENLG